MRCIWLTTVIIVFLVCQCSVLWRALTLESSVAGMTHALSQCLTAHHWHGSQISSLVTTKRCSFCLLDSLPLPFLVSFRSALASHGLGTRLHVDLVEPQRALASVVWWATFRVCTRSMLIILTVSIDAHTHACWARGRRIKTYILTYTHTYMYIHVHKYNNFLVWVIYVGLPSARPN